MNYELAKELKEAGFPQGDELYCRCSFLTRAEKEADGVEEIYDCRSERVYKPTLSELIEECGDELVYLAKDRYSGTYSGAKWLAYGWLENDYGIDGDDGSCMEFWSTNKDPVGKGSTQEEAVARLWLALQKNKALPPKQE